MKSHDRDDEIGALLSLMMFEYPHFNCIISLSRIVKADEATVRQAMDMLQGKDLIRQIEPGRFVRKVLDDKTGEW